MKNIFLQLHGTGLINQLMAIEIGIGLAAEGNNVIVHNVVQNKESPIHNANVNNLRRYSLLSKNSPKITDLIEYDKSLTIRFEDSDLSINKNNMFGPHYYSGNNTITGQKQEEFSCSRIDINSIPENDIYLTYANLWYSTFFLNRTKHINKAISSVRFKQEYYDLAEKIAKSIGVFSGAHIRLTDHAFWKVPITTEQINLYLDKLKNDQVVIATDDFDSEIIKQISKNVLILDKYIEENFMDDIQALEFSNESVFGLIVNLVMHHSKDFVSSQGSTYSGYIHRNVNQKTNGSDWKIIGEDPLSPGEFYSFSNYKDKNMLSWYREWPESYMEEDQ